MRQSPWDLPWVILSTSHHSWTDSREGGSKVNPILRHFMKNECRAQTGERYFESKRSLNACAGLSLDLLLDLSPNME
jgi:hypothetical protein